MTVLSNKSKQYGLIALKVLLLSITFGYIYMKLTGDRAIPLDEFLNTLQSKNPTPFLLFVLMAAANWILEILKWQTAASPIRSLSFGEASKQSLSALTLSLATPNRIGEYGAKAFFFESTHRKKIVLLQFFSNVAQMLVTTLFGIIGLLFVAHIYLISFSIGKIILGGIIISVLGLLGYFFKEKELLIKGFTLSNVLKYFRGLPRSLKINLSLFSVARYVIFSGLFYLLLSYFGAEISLQLAIPLITSMYLLSSIIPTIFLFDVVVKSGVALWLFSLAELPQWPVLCTVLTMWLLNFVFPAIWGSYYVISYRSS